MIVVNNFRGLALSKYYKESKWIAWVLALKLSAAFYHK